jgi:alkanesulfonate monooxygenase SsuD/methylene tetrahydromethanopterin reductase-like flavin-dependent oxidoreductase (luciferase family)
MPFEKPLARTREYIEIVNLAVRGERVSYNGQFYKLNDFRMRFNTIRPHIPVSIAALGPKNVELAGELADSWSPVFFSPLHLKQFQAQIAAGAAKAGRQLSNVSLAPWMIACVSSDTAHAKALARGHIAYYVGGMGRYYNELMQRYGFQEEAARIKDLWVTKRDREGAQNAVTDAMIDAVGIIGDAKRCRQRVLDIQAQGVDSPVLFVPYGASWNVVRETIEGLAPNAFR